MPRIQLKHLLPGLRTWDMFGHVPSLNFNGKSAFTTYPGTVVSVIIYGLILLNTVQLAIAFLDGSKQTSQFNSDLIDLFDVDEPQYFTDNQVEIAMVTNRHIPEEIGQFVAY